MAINLKGIPWTVQTIDCSASMNKQLLMEIVKAVIKNYRIKDNKAAIICSLENSSVQRLLEEAMLSSQQGSTHYLSIIEELQRNYLETAKEIIQDEHILASLESELVNELYLLTRFLNAVQIIKELSHRSKEKVLRVAETLTILTISSVLKDKGIQIRTIDLGKRIITSSDCDSFVMRSSQMIHEYDGIQVPIITILSEHSPSILIDTSAAVDLRQEHQLNVSNKRVAESISSSKVLVIQPFMDIQANTPTTHMKYTTAENLLSTGILPEEQQKSTTDHSFLGYTTPPLTPGKESCLEWQCPMILHVAVKHNMSLLHIYSNKRYRSHEFLARLFNLLEKHGIPIDLNLTSAAHVCLTWPTDILIDKALIDIKTLGQVDITTEMSVISLVTERQMKHSSRASVEAKLLSALANAGILVDCISQSSASSQVHISIIMRERYAASALKVIHENIPVVDPFTLCVQQTL